MTPTDPDLARLRALARRRYTRQRHAPTATEGPLDATEGPLDAIAALYEGSPCPGCGEPPAEGSLSCADCFAAMTWRVTQAVSRTYWET